VSREAVVTQEHSARPYQQIEACVEARFCAPLVVDDVVVSFSTRLWSLHDVGRGDITERVQRTNESIERTLELSRRLDEVLSRPIRWV
jgi:hypothetical protein